MVNTIESLCKNEGLSGEILIKCKQRIKRHLLSGNQRMIQSIPSPKAEPFKLWLAQLASECLDEMQDQEMTIDRALE